VERLAARRGAVAAPPDRAPRGRRLEARTDRGDASLKHRRLLAWPRLAAATAALAILAGAAVGASAAAGRRDALARAAAFEFETGRPDRAATLAAEALAAGADAAAVAPRGSAAKSPPATPAPSDAALRFLRAEALLAAGDIERARAERDVALLALQG
jgi:hypothetical protein